jgi:integrase
MALRFSKLTRPAIRQLGPGEKLAEHGITVVRLANSDVRYAVGVMVDGQRIHRVIGLGSDGVTRTQCEEFIEAKRTEARAGRLALPRRRKLALSFAAAAARYVELLDGGGGKNIRVKRRQLRMYLVPHLGSLRLDAISEFAIDTYKKRRKDQCAANGTVNRELTTLSHLFYCAVEWRWIDRVPVRIGKRLLAEGEGRIIALSEQQCETLMTAALASGHPDLWLFVAFGLNTAMRHDEIINARWEHLDLANRRLFIPKAKAGKREQPITAELAAILERERACRDDREGWVFPSPYTGTATGRRGNLRRPFAKAVVRAGLDPAVTPHVMRHTAITKLVQAGVDVPTIQRISGHKTVAMVLRYVHVHGQHIDEGIAALGRGLPASHANMRGDEPGISAEHDYTGITHTPSRRLARRTKKPGIS